MKIGKQAQGILSTGGSPKISLGLTSALVLAGRFASFTSYAGASP